MGWKEFQSYIKAMNKQNEVKTTSPDSWAGVENDSWWANARRERDEEQRR
jgi:hypothetical protein